MTRGKIILVGAALCGIAVAQAQLSGLKPVTMQGDVMLTRTVMSMPGMSGMDTGAVTATFRRVRGGSGIGRGPDACAVTRNTSAATQPGASFLGGGSATEEESLDAGDPIAVRSTASPYALLRREKMGKSISYRSASPLPAPTAALVVDVPGAPGGFPAFNAVAFPSTTVVHLTAPKDGAVSLETKFEWSNPTNDVAMHVLFVGTDEDERIGLVCTARDDGAFTFPDATRAELKRLGFRTGSLKMVGRQGTKVHRVVDAQLNVHATTMQVMMPSDQYDSSQDEQE